MRTILLAGDRARAALHDLLADEQLRVRILTRQTAMGGVLEQLGVEVVHGGLDDCASIRSAVKNSHGVFAAATTLSEARNVVKVVAATEVEQFLLAVPPADQPAVESFAASLGVDVAFVDADSATAAAAAFTTNEEEHTCPTSCLPLFL